jgi:hypothetical protein
MSLSRVSDEEIQEYLDGNLGPREIADFRDKLESCEVSQEKLREYLCLYKALRAEQTHCLSPALVDAIMEKLPPLEEPKKRLNIAYVFAGVIGFVTLVGLLHYFIDLSPVVERLVTFPLFRMELNWEVFKPALALFQKLNEKCYLFGFIALVLMFIKVVDFMLLNRDYQKAES